MDWTVNKSDHLSKTSQAQPSLTTTSLGPGFWKNLGPGHCTIAQKDLKERRLLKQKKRKDKDTHVSNTGIFIVVPPSGIEVMLITRSKSLAVSICSCVSSWIANIKFLNCEKITIITNSINCIYTIPFPYGICEDSRRDMGPFLINSFCLGWFGWVGLMQSNWIWSDLDISHCFGFLDKQLLQPISVEAHL